MTTRPRIYRRPSWWRRACLRLDCSPFEFWFMAAFWLYLIGKVLEAKARGWL